MEEMFMYMFSVALVIVLILVVLGIIAIKIYTLCVIKKAESMKSEIISLIDVLSVEDFDVKEINTKAYITTMNAALNCISFTKKRKTVTGDIIYDCIIPNDHIRHNESIKTDIDFENMCKLGEKELQITATEEMFNCYKENVLDKDITHLEAEVYAIAITLKDSYLKSRIKEWYEYLRNKSSISEQFDLYASKEKALARFLLCTFVAEKIKVYSLILQEPFTDLEKNGIVEIVINEIKTRISMKENEE